MMRFCERAVYNLYFVNGFVNGIRLPITFPNEPPGRAILAF